MYIIFASTLLNAQCLSCIACHSNEFSSQSRELTWFLRMKFEIARRHLVQQWWLTSMCWINILCALCWNGEVCHMNIHCDILNIVLFVYGLGIWCDSAEMDLTNTWNVGLSGSTLHNAREYGAIWIRDNINRL